jgi:hypothetical protein
MIIIKNITGLLYLQYSYIKQRHDLAVVYKRYARQHLLGFKKLIKGVINAKTGSSES